MQEHLLEQESRIQELEARFVIQEHLFLIIFLRSRFSFKKERDETSSYLQLKSYSIKPHFFKKMAIIAEVELKTFIFQDY